MRYSHRGVVLAPPTRESARIALGSSASAQLLPGDGHCPQDGIE